ncbi:phosphohistidine phosphatase SixA [Leptospira sp. GIMC2001]|uniref:phosphohistidine phosphatase SixA n=1 Tax=Leptospira sp. GIMC2001 TaxID=1513297 RepID=UPI00234ADB50|nr:phosphohistidine phosphatase SixA [Leptospira sp. GIMC2001]WCL51288.1 phosphohistidine phosphatase SixA [Leptospira sp. GIMC2001]
MKIILVRHGEAEDVSIAGSDRRRKLTAKGTEDIHKIGSFIRNSHIKISQIYHSPFERTKKTALILAEELHLEEHMVSAEEISAGMDCCNLLPQLCDYSNSDAIVIVGHNPDITYFAAKLLGESAFTNSLLFTPGTSIAVNVPKEKFSKGQLLWSVSPDFLMPDPSRQPALSH